METKGACAGEASADLARPHGIHMRVGQGVPGLTHSQQSAVRDEDADGLVVESHASQVGSSRYPAEGGRLPLVTHIRA